MFSALSDGMLGIRSSSRVTAASGTLSGRLK